MLQYARIIRRANPFISFIHEEIGFAECVQRFIRETLRQSVDPFLSTDQFKVYAGEKWLDRIMEELARAKAVIVMLSLKFNISGKRRFFLVETLSCRNMWTSLPRTFPS